MKISVVTTVRNGAKTIRQTLESVASQDYDNIEHIVVDGDSTDGTQQIIESFDGSLIRYISEPDSGIYDGMNKGIEMASGDIVGFLNSDDYYADCSVLTQVASCFKDEKIEGCYANLLYVDAEDTSKIVRFWNSKEYEPGMFECGWMPAHPTFYARREVYQRCGLFDTTLKFQSDFEHTARLIAVNKINTRYINQIWVHMRMGGTTNRSIGNIVKGNLESYKACKKLGLQVTPVYFVRKFMMRIPQFFKRPNK